jgi:ABC-2 type transport system ATP-binding protein
MSITVNNLSKHYGSQKAVDAISFSVNKGEIVGFLGPNGAGKSTVMKALTGYINDFQGNATINNIDISENKIAAQKLIGYLPEHNPLYLEMYVREYLVFHAEIYQVNMNQIETIITEVGLTSHAHKKISELSKGFRQRVGLAVALLHRPEVLILDEPTTGLDPNQLAEIRDLIKKVGKDKTVLFSTHIMQEVENVCDRVIILHKGKIVADKKIEELRKNQDQVIEVEFDIKIEKQFIQNMDGLKQFHNVFDTTWQLHFSDNEDRRPQVFDFAQQNGLKILNMNRQNKSLEQLFKELTEN